ncbi:TPA: AAA family ATPase [Raoultella planticola]|uniref:AAA family ATPase n=1 Tax=Raoultella planticola TaxID=575 RepID=UPI000BA0529C|nr:AAA family ATPase [Raoultella planticola]OZP70400.1 hypothetical protein CIG23_29070 [Raoultella planticola]HEC2625630.1 AAA family ATPase [Raoultella planticola]
MLLNKIILNDLEIDLINEHDISNRDNYFSLIVGKNGSGKSRILEAIAVSGILRDFLKREGDRCDKGSAGGLLISKYSSMEFLKDVSSDSIKMVFSLDELNFIEVNKFSDSHRQVNYHNALFECKNCGRDEFINVICVTNGLFNKFPRLTMHVMMMREYFDDFYKNISASEIFYRYAQTNREYSICGYLSQSITKCFFSDNKKYEMTVSFLKRFGVFGRFKIIFKANKNLRGVSDAGVFDVNELKECFSVMKNGLGGIKTEIPQKIIGLIDETFKEMFAISGVKIEFEHPSAHFFLDRDLLSVEFNSWEDVDFELYKKIKVLSEYNIVEVRGFLFERDGRELELESISSGELNILFLMFKINSVIEDNSVILIDEPEISLHPKWQNEIVPALKDVFASYSGCHFIIATHSPHVVASIPKENSSVIILNSWPETHHGSRFSGRSSDYQLFSVLGFIGDENDYLTMQLIIIISKLSASEKLDSREFFILDKAKDLLSRETTSHHVKHLLLQAQRLSKGFENE